MGVRHSGTLSLEVRHGASTFARSGTNCRMLADIWPIQEILNKCGTGTLRKRGGLGGIVTGDGIEWVSPSRYTAEYFARYNCCAVLTYLRSIEATDNALPHTGRKVTQSVNNCALMHLEATCLSIRMQAHQVVEAPRFLVKGLRHRSSEWGRSSRHMSGRGSWMLVILRLSRVFGVRTFWLRGFQRRRCLFWTNQLLLLHTLDMV